MHLILGPRRVHLQLTVNLFLVLRGTEDAVNTTCRVVLGLIFGFKGEDGYISECWGWTSFDETLEVVLLEEHVLDFNPTHWGCKLVG